MHARRGAAASTATLHMEVDVAEADIEAETDYVGALSRQPGSLIVGAIAACRPEEPASPPFSSGRIELRCVKGFRRVLHVMPDELSEGALFRENLKRLAGTGLTFDLVVLPHQIPKAIALADLAPDVQFVLDHCGVPDIKDGAEHPWREQMTEIARRPNVAGKISGVVAYADPDELDGRDAAALCRAHDRRLRLGPRRLGQRLAGLHAGRRAVDLGRGHPCADRRRQRRRAGKLLSGNAKRIWQLG